MKMKNLNEIMTQDELDQMIAETTWMADRPRTWTEYISYICGLDIKFFHPFNFLVVKKPTMESNWDVVDDIYQYGFSLDLTTEIYYYTYDWGKGFNFRLLGFGFEVCKVGK